MPRGLTSDQKTEIAKRVTSCAYFVALELVSTTVRVWNGRGDVTALSNTWKGLGELGIIQGIESDRSLKAQQITLALVGLPGSLLTAGIVTSTRSERYQGRPVTVYFAITNSDTGALIGNPVAIWGGFADVLQFQIGETASVALTAEHLSSRLRRANGARMTTESHNQSIGNPSPRDLFFEVQNRLMGVPKPLLQGSS